MTSERARAALLALAAVFCASASASEAGAELGRLIDGSSELAAVFQRSRIEELSAQRARVVAERNQQRHALVIYRSTPASKAINEQFCTAALSAPERDDWRERLTRSLAGDHRLAERLAASRAPQLRLAGLEHAAIKSPPGWQAVVCVVRLKDFLVDYPALPTRAEIDQARYAEAKALYAAGRLDESLEQLKALRESDVYPDALLYVVAALEAKQSPLAETLRKQHVRLERVSDPDALRLYRRISLQGGYEGDAAATLRRCQTLGLDCPAPRPVLSSPQSAH